MVKIANKVKTTLAIPLTIFANTSKTKIPITNETGVVVKNSLTMVKMESKKFPPVEIFNNT